MKAFTREHKQAFMGAAALTLALVSVATVLFVSGDVWPTTNQPHTGEPAAQVNDDMIAAGLAYVQTLPLYTQSETPAVVYQQYTAANDGVIILVYTSEGVLADNRIRQSYLVLHQNGHIIGHEMRISDEAGLMEVLSPEPEQIIPRDRLVVRVKTKEPQQAVTLTLTNDATGTVIFATKQVSAADGLAIFTVPALARGQSALMLSLTVGEATIRYPISIDQT